MFQIKPLTIAWFLAGCVGLLLLGHVIGMTLKFGFGESFFIGFVPLMDFDREGNLPTFFSSTVLMVSALLLALIALSVFRRNGEGWLRWSFLSLLFLFVSLDESISIHEQLIEPVREWFSLSGVFYFAWVIPYGLVLLVLAAIYLPFVLKWPRRIRNLGIAAATVFLTGALGFELLGGYYFESVNEELNLTYALITTTEELLEMLGVVIFIYALLSYIQTEFDGISIRIAPATASRVELDG